MSTTPPLRGSLETVSFPGLIRSLVSAGRTGVLRFSLAHGNTTKTVYISQGRLIFATSTDSDDRLGEQLLRKGLITYRTLEDSVQAIQAGKRQGTILVERGAIRSKHLVEGVMEQVQEIIFSLFRFEEGEYEFIEGDLPSREVIVLRMSTPDIVMEGTRRVTGWRRIREGLGRLDQRYTLGTDAPRHMAGMSLQKEELNLVALLDGVLSVEEICSQARGNDFLTCRALWGLWASGVLDRVPQDREVAVASVRDETDPHAELLRGASVGKELDRFNELHKLLFELVTFELRDQAAAFFERAFAEAIQEQGDLYDGVAVDTGGELDSFALRKNIATREIASYTRGLDRLLEIETELARTVLGERKAGIIQDGLLALRQRQLETRGPLADSRRA
jgi:YD repeat-containing protein